MKIIIQVIHHQTLHSSCTVYEVLEEVHTIALQDAELTQQRDVAPNILTYVIFLNLVPLHKESTNGAFRDHQVEL